MTVITISRQFGSGGFEITNRVCELLGYRYLDKLLMTQVAAEVGLCGKELADFSEEHHKAKRFLDRLLMPGYHGVVRISVRSQDSAGRETLSEAQLDQARCANLVRSAIYAAHEQGDVVIVGRGGQATLQDVPGVLHVRIEAPLADRILRIQEREGVGPDEARELVRNHDQMAAKYLATLFDIRWDDPLLYHMVVNTGKLDLEAAALTIVSLVQQLQADPVA
jgi:cytidylate kinase